MVQLRVQVLPHDGTDGTRKPGTSRRPVSVRLSVTLMYCIEKAKDMIKLFSSLAT